MHSVERFEDEATGQPAFRVGSTHRFVQLPTYHLGAAFADDAPCFPAAAWTPGGGSALLLVDADRGECREIARRSAGDPGQFDEGNHAARIPGRDATAVSNVGRQLIVVDHATGRERVLLEIDPPLSMGHPTPTRDGRAVVVPVQTPWQPNTEPPLWSVEPWVRYVSVDLDSGAQTTLWEDRGCRCNHLIENPHTPGLFLIDRDFPPGFSYYGDGGMRPRVWMTRFQAGGLIPVVPRARHRFQIHSNWSADGQHVYYHGIDMEPGRLTREGVSAHYIGVAGLDGLPVWERTFPFFHYGHTGSHPVENAILIDGLVIPGLVCLLRWTPGDAPPRIEVLARHGTDSSVPGQKSHPHPHVSKCGRFLAFNRAWVESGDPRSTVVVVRMP